MNKKIAFLFLLLCVFVFFPAETLHAQILPRNASREDIQNKVDDRNGTSSNAQTQRQSERMQGDLARPRTLSQSTFRRDRLSSDPFFRRSTKSELDAIRPEQADLDTYAEFLHQPKTGLIRFVDGIECTKNFVIS